MTNNNKGFTLVELIIVVAIIAILSAVLAPQYLQYVERSRESNDVQIANNLMDASILALSDPANDVPAGTVVTFEWVTSGTVPATAFSVSGIPNRADGTSINDEIDAIVGLVYLPGAAESESGRREHFIYTVDTSTGELTINDDGDTEGLDYILKQIK